VGDDRGIGNSGSRDLLIGATFALRRLAASVVELTVGVGLLVATLGFELAASGGS